jgi:hypothetical protein
VADTAEFAAGLLRPQQPVPALVKGQIERRYGVYRNNVTVGLIRALEANFPVVRRLLGEDYFAGFARDFAQNHPPRSPLMFQYGKAFPQVLDNAEDLANFPYLGDIARLEILWRESYHGADAHSLAVDALAAIDPDVLFDCRFKVHPATRLIQSHFAVYDIFAANGPEADGQVSDPGQAQCVLVTRPQLDVILYTITADQLTFFQALTSGENLGDALDRAAALNPNFDITAALALLLQSGAFQTIQQGNEKPS